MAVYHLLTISLASIFVFVIIFCVIGGKRKNIHIPASFEKDTEFIEEIRRLARVCTGWKRANILSIAFHYGLNIFAMYFSLATAYIASTNSTDSDSIVLYSILAVTFSLFELLAQPKKWGQGYRIAFEGLTIALSNYFSGAKDWQTVLNAFETGEQIITQKFYNDNANDTCVTKVPTHCCKLRVCPYQKTLHKQAHLQEDMNNTAEKTITKDKE
ncbi:MAG: hypothetical protein IJE29_01025 [Firmicutes bacterium]|nr:hypothetical protein [Bacillota bacterium]